MTRPRQLGSCPLPRRSRPIYFLYFAFFTIIFLFVYVLFFIDKNFADENVPEFSASDKESNTFLYEAIKNGTANIQTKTTTEKPNPTQFVSAVLVICSNRPSALSNHLEQLVRLRPNALAFPIVISQDGFMHDVKDVAERFVASHKNISYMQHERFIPPGGKKNNYASIAYHYKWALDRTFSFGYSTVIITEDDLDIGEDFFSYFIWAKQMLQLDNSLWCASAWNDNGIPALIDNSRTNEIRRTDFFPGLGWMLFESLWKELSPNWPTIYWDDWMRTQEVRKGRSCLRPEISRTAHNMKLAGKGSSNGLYKSFLSEITAAQDSVDFSLVPHEPLMKNYYNEHLQVALAEALQVNATDVNDTTWDPSHQYRIVYYNVRQWFILAKLLGIMVDIRSGMTRTAYYSVVSVQYKNCRVHIHPAALDIKNITSWQYDSEWDKMYRYLEFELAYCKKGKYEGKCDPHSKEMREWFVKKKWLKKLNAWGEMIVIP